MLTLENLKNLYPDVSSDIWNMLDNLDAYTYNHSVRMCEIAQKVEKELHLEEKDLSESCLLHDIGKYFVSQKVLGKHSGLSKMERDFINGHAWFSYMTLSNYNIKTSVCLLALYHHTTEPIFFNKKIEPCKDTEIIHLAKIIKTIDIYEALSTDRPYHRGLSNSTIEKEFEGIVHDEETLNIIIASEEFSRK